MPKSDLLAPLRDRDFARLWLGQAVSNAGDWVNYVALTALVWDLTGSAWMVAVLRACHAVPFLLLSPFAGVLVDRWNRKTTMIVVDLLRAGLALLFPLLQDVGTILLLTVLYNAFATLFLPAKNALIPRIATAERLLAANSLSSTTQNMAMVMGPALGGAIIAYGGTASAFYFQSGSFLFSAIAIATMAVSGASAHGSDQRVSARQELAEGFRFSSGHSEVRSLFLLEVGLMLGWGCVNVLAIVIAEKVLGGGAPEFGLLLSSIGLGSVAGAVLTAGVGNRIRTARIFPLGFLIVAAGVALLAGSRMVLTAAAAYFVAGAGRMVIDVAATTLYQRAVPDSLLGRIFALRNMIVHTALLTSNQIAGLVTDAASIGPVLMAATLLELGCALLSAILLAGPWRPHWKHGNPTTGPRHPG